MNILRQLAPVAMVLLTPAATAQTNGFFFKVSNDISPQQPSATVELWAFFDPTLLLLHDLALDMRAAPDQGMFSDPAWDDKTEVCSWTDPGVVSPDGDAVSGITLFQFACGGGCFPPSDNPFHILSYTWSTDEFHPRAVGLGTITSKFKVLTQSCEIVDVLHEDFAEATGQITIVPAPAGVFAMALAGVTTIGRRKR